MDRKYILHHSGLAVFLALIMLGFCLFPASSYADQPESEVACVEGDEPLERAYGDHTAGCAIDPATDLDRFRFCGSMGLAARA